MTFFQRGHRYSFEIEGPLSKRARRAICLMIFRSLKPLLRLDKANIVHRDGHVMSWPNEWSRPTSLAQATRLTAPTERRGSAIRMRRLMLGWTQEELALKAAVSRSHVSRIEHGRHVPQDGTLIRVQRALGVD